MLQCWALPQISRAVTFALHNKLHAAQCSTKAKPSQRAHISDSISTATKEMSDPCHIQVNKMDVGLPDLFCVIIEFNTIYSFSTSCYIAATFSGLQFIFLPLVICVDWWQGPGVGPCVTLTPQIHLTLCRWGVVLAQLQERKRREWFMGAVSGLTGMYQPLPVWSLFSCINVLEEAQSGCVENHLEYCT